MKALVCVKQVVDHNVRIRIKRDILMLIFLIQNSVSIHLMKLQLKKQYV